MLKVWCYGSQVKGEFPPEKRIREVKVTSDENIQKNLERHNMENTKREGERIKGDVPRMKEREMRRSGI